MLDHHGGHQEVVYPWKGERQVAEGEAVESLVAPEVPFKKITETTAIKPVSPEPEPLDALIALHERKLHYFVKSKCANLSDVEDIVQETCLQAVLSYDRFSGRSSFSTWLLGIALNLIRNYYNRSPNYKYAILDSDVLQYHESGELNPEQVLEQCHDLNSLDHQMQRLPDMSRSMLMLFAVEGLCYDEIAKRFGVSVASVKSRLFRAREQLREVLKA